MAATSQNSSIDSIVLTATAIALIFRIMPKINLQFDTKSPAKEVYDKVKGFLTTDDSIKKLDSKISFNFADDKMSGTAQGSAFKANLMVENKDAGCRVNMEVDLSFLLTPFKNKVQEVLERKLSKLLG